MCIGSRGFVWGTLLSVSCTIGCEFRVETDDEHSLHDDASSSFDTGETGDLPDTSWSDSSSNGVTSGPRPEPPEDPPLPVEEGRPNGRAPVDVFRELMVIDPAVLTSPEASNTIEGAPLSFRSAMEWLAGDAPKPEDFVRAWLGQWENVTEVGPYSAPVTPRPTVNELLIEPWWTEKKNESVADWARLPFHLLAVVNRVDLTESSCNGSKGELRLVYGASNASGRPLEMTVIFEIPYPRTKEAFDWAHEWRKLLTLPQEAYNSGLGALVRTVMEDTDPFAVRVRSNELALGESLGLPWELRDFRLEERENERFLSMVPLEFTPRTDIETKLVAEHVVTHFDELMKGPVPLAEPLRGATASMPTADFTWSIPQVSNPAQRAFSQETCNGCHAADTSTFFQHISEKPTRPGEVRLSSFLHNPGRPTDELRRRARVFELLLDTNCPGIP